MDPVKEYMVKNVKDIDAGASALDAAEKLATLGIGSLMVREKGEYIGMVSETEIVRQLVAKKRDSKTISVTDIMNTDIDYIEQVETMSKAIAIMREKKLRYLVVRNGGTVVGILSVKDLLAFYEKWFTLTL